MFKGKLQVAFGFAILALLALGAISYRWVVVSTDSAKWVQHSHDVLESVHELVNTTGSITSNSRAYALTGDVSYLNAYRGALDTIAQKQETVRTLIADNSQQQHQVRKLEQLAAEQITNAARTIELRETRGLQAAADAVASGADARNSAEFRSATRQFQEEEQRLLELRDADTDKRLSETKTILISGTILGLLIAGVVGWSARRDGSARGAAERSLRDSEDKYRTLLDGVQDYSILMLDPQGLVVSWSAGAGRITGYTADEMVGRSFSCFFTPDDIKRARPGEILRLADVGSRHEEYGPRVRKDGSQFLTDVIYTALRDPAGDLRGFSEISRDLTGSMESDAKYRGLLEAAPDAMLVVNQSGEIVILNLQTETQFGYRRDELVGRAVKTIIPEGFAERLVADSLRSAEDALAQQIGTGIELSGRRKDGSVFPIEIMLSPLESADGILVTAAIRNITARKTAEADLVKKVEELKRSNAELAQFAYLASHDLQEPLRMVASYTQLLSRRYKGKLDADADEFIAYAVDGANRMQRLIQGLLSYSRVDTKGKELLAISSEEMLRQALMNLGGAIEERGALVTHDPLPMVTGDELQLIQLFQNLISNAIKYQNPGVPRVHISAVKRDDEHWIFSVRDNGLGIESQYFERIFGMFQRLHKREEFEGTGIGLAICKKIVERHGGTISVESKLGEGSTFHFALHGA